MISVLISGRLHERPVSRETKKGGQMVTAKLIAEMRGSQYGQWINVVAFSDSACGALLGCAQDEAISISGDLQVGTYTGNDGITRADVKVVASAVLTMRGASQSQPRKKAQSRDATGDPHYEGATSGNNGRTDTDGDLDYDRPF